jgi:hypothetical protein
VLSPPPPIVIRICDIYIGTAQKLVIGPVDDGTVKFITTACQNDLTLSFDLQVKHILYIYFKIFSFFQLAQTAVVTLIHRSLAQIPAESYQNATIKAEANIQTALLTANRLAAAIITQDNSCFEQKRCLTNDGQ